MYLADQEMVGRFELYRVAARGGATIKLNGVLVSGGSVKEFRISPDSASVVYQANQDTADVLELYRVPLAGGDDKLNGAARPGRQSKEAFDQRGQHLVVDRADQDTDNVKGSTRSR